ncbi:hypothetical protein ACFU7Y_18385 [Kitasatospora sp. NPDC057542]|uniref:hypothetical protein n=1 Tax=Kitasatospora sp. NPDC057542 TaxID=3346162 RepID=UPI0036AFF9A8
MASARCGAPVGRLEEYDTERGTWIAMIDSRIVSSAPGVPEPVYGKSNGNRWPRSRTGMAGPLQAAGRAGPVDDHAQVSSISTRAFFSLAVVLRP